MLPTHQKSLLISKSVLPPCQHDKSLEIKDGVAILQFGGGCNGCSMVDFTLKEGIEKQLLEQFPGELTGVKDATEHQAGDHSYYS